MTVDEEIFCMYVDVMDILKLKFLCYSEIQSRMYPAIHENLITKLRIKFTIH